MPATRAVPIAVWRALRCGGAPALAALLATPAVAAAAPVTSDWSCTFGSGAQVDVALTVDAELPSQVSMLRAATAPTDVLITSSAVDALGATSVTGSIELTASTPDDSSTGRFEDPGAVSEPVGSTFALIGGSDGLAGAVGLTYVAKQLGAMPVTLEGVRLTLDARDAGGEPLLSGTASCDPVAADDADAAVLLGTSDASDAAPTPPADVTDLATPTVTSNGATLTWTQPTEGPPPVQWIVAVFRDGREVTTTTTREPTAVLTGLTPETDYEVEVVADAGAGASSGTTTTSFTTPTYVAPPESRAYDVRGGARIQPMLRGNMSVAGTVGIDVASSGDVTGAVVIDPAPVSLRANFNLPVYADLTWTESTPATGTWQDGALKLSTSQSFTIANAKVFGIALSYPAACGSGSPVAMELLSEGAWSLDGGGTLSTRFSVPDIKDCGFLGLLVPSSTASTGNVMSLAATPRAAATPTPTPTPTPTAAPTPSGTPAPETTPAPEVTSAPEATPTPDPAPASTPAG